MVLVVVPTKINRSFSEFCCTSMCEFGRSQKCYGNTPYILGQPTGFFNEHR